MENKIFLIVILPIASIACNSCSLFNHLDWQGA